jgi:hypothetical protein
MWLCFLLTLKFIFVGSLVVGLSPVLEIFKPYDSGFGTLFQIQELLGPFQKPGLPPDLQYTLPQTEYCISTKF